jgi:predicted nucleotidyltransferase
MPYGLSESTLEKINNVLQRYPQVSKAILYGSRAKGNYREGSDIDLTLCGDHLNNALLNKIEQDLDDLLLPYLFDISLYHHIDNEDLLKHIDEIGVAIYTN